MKPLAIILLLTLAVTLTTSYIPSHTEVYHVYYEYTIIEDSRGHLDTIPGDTTYIPYKVILDYEE